MTTFVLSAMCQPTWAANPDSKSRIPTDRSLSNWGTHGVPNSRIPAYISDSPRYSGSFTVPSAPQRKSAPKANQKLPSLERVSVKLNPNGYVSLKTAPNFNTSIMGTLASLSQNNDFVYYGLNPILQQYAADIVKKAKAPHVALVAMDPRTGRILAMSGKSKTIARPELYANFPAASLFKIVTTAAALEKAGLDPYYNVYFRGGNYTLNQWNYKPDQKKDRRYMSLADALGKSCNPVFARVALKFLSPSVLRYYAEAFRFNSDLNFDIPLNTSRASIPSDAYELSRTAAGFGEVRLSPIHAVALMSGIANGGLLPRPLLIDKIVSQEGKVLYHSDPEIISRVVQPQTAKKLLQMMEKTTTIGTSRKAFMRKNRSILGVPVSAKTGTLRGENPEGINNWFLAAAPSNNPTIAVAIVVVHPQGQHIKASQLGRMIIEKHLKKS